VARNACADSAVSEIVLAVVEPSAVASSVVASVLGTLVLVLAVATVDEDAALAGAEQPLSRRLEDSARVADQTAVLGRIFMAGLPFVTIGG